MKTLSSCCKKLVLLLILMCSVSLMNAQKSVAEKLDESSEYFGMALEYLDKKDHANALIYFKRSFEIEKALPDDAQMAGYLELTPSLIADCYTALNQPDMAILYAKEAVKYCKKLNGSESHNYVDALYDLAIYYFNSKKYSESASTLQEAIILAKKVYGENSPKYAKMLKDFTYVKKVLASE
ncbi:MAG: tetratricopeptide repeat protein [Paludibacteraceae bacterium]|nr:tetratricopeptide repeat protein [Paludibacteraceae bacterium]